MFFVTKIKLKRHFIDLPCSWIAKDLLWQAWLLVARWSRLRHKAGFSRTNFVRRNAKDCWNSARLEGAQPFLQITNKSVKIQRLFVGRMASQFGQWPNPSRKAMLFLFLRIWPLSEFKLNIFTYISRNPNSSLIFLPIYFKLNIVIYYLLGSFQSPVSLTSATIQYKIFCIDLWL